MPDDILEAPITSTKADAGDGPAPAPTTEAKTVETTPAPTVTPKADAVTPAPKGETPAKAAPTDDLDIDESDETDTPATFPDNWREQMAGDDAKFLGQLKRYATPQNFAKAYNAMRQKLSSGEYKRAALPEGATDVEKAEWRKENGIPDSVDGYTLPEIKNHQWSDDDKPIISDFLAELHGADTPQPVAAAALAWYAKFQQRQIEARADLDRTRAEQREDALRKDWGPGDYRPHVQLARTMFNDENFIPGNLRHALADARLSDGSRLLHNPDLMRFLAQQGLERKGTAGLISGEQGARIGNRIGEIRQIMREDNDRYVRENLGAELVELMEKQGNSRGRAA